MGSELVGAATTYVDAGALAGLGGGRPGATGSLEDRKEVVDRAVPPPGDVVLDDVTLSTSSVPAPARMIEVSGGDTALGLDADHLSLGQVYAGEARTEVARVVLPPWVPGEPLELTVTATYRDVASGRKETARASIRCRYSADVEEISRARHGDVIAYASALAMVRRLHRAFLGSEVDRPGGVRRIAGLQATSLAELGRVQHDPALDHPGGDPVDAARRHRGLTVLGSSSGVRGGSMPPMRVIPVPCLSDNYAYLVAADGAEEAFVVDPSEAEPVIAALEREGLRLVAIVNTHHHHDHVGGNEALRARYGALPVYAHESDEGRVPAQTAHVVEGRRFHVAGLELDPIHVPGHTTGAVAYVVEDCGLHRRHPLRRRLRPPLRGHARR